MLLYRHFRLRKYGEPIPVPKKSGDDIEDMFQEDTDMLLKIKSLMNNRFDMGMGPIEEAKGQDEVDQISDFGSEEGENQA